MHKLLIPIFVFLLISCSSSPTLIEKSAAKIIKSSSLKNESRKSKKKIYTLGPTQKKTLVFKDRTTQYGLAEIKASSFYAVDFNHDFKTDLVYLPDYYSTPIFLENKNNKFVKITYNPFKNIPRASYLVFHDFNKDNLLDLVAVTFNQHASLKKEPIKIYRAIKKNGKIFYQLEKSNLSSKAYPVSSVSLIDYDLDGKIDIFLGNWFASQKVGKTRTPNRIYKGLGDFRFSDVSYLLPNEISYSKSFQNYLFAAPTMGVSICDVDQNGYPDILTSNSSGYKNKLWLNLYDKSNNGRIFKNYGEQSFFASDAIGKFGSRNAGNSFFSICADYNNDGMIDIAVGEVYHAYDGEEKDRSSILTGSTFDFPPQFIRSEYYKDDGSGNWNEGDKRGVWLDYNNDGLKDLLVDNSGFPPNSRLIFFEQAKNHGFKDVASTIGIDVLNPSGTITLDVNNDGRMDLLTGQTSLRLGEQKTRVYLFENNSKWNGNRSIRFFLKSNRSNAAGIGASIYLKTSIGIFTNFVQYNFGPQSSQMETGQSFGILKGARIKDVEVRWPIKKNGAPLTRNYDLSSFNFKYHVDVTLCEDGRFKLGKKFKACEYTDSKK